jgi:hypothetical protein
LKKSGALDRNGVRPSIYVRTLLIQGARSTLQSAINAEPSRANRLQHWIIALYGRKGYAAIMFHGVGR